MLDQRGTGLSSPIDRNTLPLRGTAEEQAAYLEHFRADSIVADAELIRAALGLRPWSIYGQSYGGFCALTYLSLRARGAEGSPYHRRAGPAVRPGGRRLPCHLPARRGPERRILQLVPRGPADGGADRPPPPREPRNSCPTAAASPWSGSRWWAPSWAATPGWTACTTCWRTRSPSHPHGARLSDAFLEQVQGIVSRLANPLYALMHESIYGQGQASDWAAWRVLQEYPEFRPDAPSRCC